MSLYCFGKVIPPLTALSELAVEGCRISVPDDEDIQELNKENLLSDNGSYFSICDSEGGLDATNLWNDAMARGLNYSESVLLKAIRILLDRNDIKIGAIAFVDGGIETVFVGTRDECWEGILARASKPWDTIDNPLFIWQR